MWMKSHGDLAAPDTAESRNRSLPPLGVLPFVLCLMSVNSGPCSCLLTLSTEPPKLSQREALAQPLSRLTNLYLHRARAGASDAAGAGSRQLHGLKKRYEICSREAKVMLPEARQMQALGRPQQPHLPPCPRHV